MIEDIKITLSKNIESKFIYEDSDNWNMLLQKCKYAPLQYKENFIRYQEAYFKDVYDSYEDCSMVLYRGGKAVGVWPLCIIVHEGKLRFGTVGTEILAPVLPELNKDEAKRKVYKKCLDTMYQLIKKYDGSNLLFSEVVMDQGVSLWFRKLMETGAKTRRVTYSAFADLSLSQAEIQNRIRRTNKYSIAKGNEQFVVEIYDRTSENADKAFDEFHNLHIQVAGRITRSQLTWDIQKQGILEKNIGYSFLVLIRDKNTDELAGAALFDTTHAHGLYCVAAYDRSRFSQPVGHIVQAVAMEKMREYGIRWYEIGERTYVSDDGATDKTVAIGHYKEGFCTHMYPKIVIDLDYDSYILNTDK